jgi:hypothetical protein
MRNSKIFAVLFALSITLGANLVVLAQNGNPRPRKFDEFTGDAGSEDIKARLHNFAIELQKQLNVQGHVIMYRSRREPPGISYRYVERARNYLVETRGLAPDRIVAVEGGTSDCFLYELWLGPVNGPLPERRFTYERTDSGVAYLFDLLDTWVNDEAEVLPTADGNDWHLSAFAAELKKNPKSRAYIIAYPRYCTDCLYDGHKAILQRDDGGTIRNILQAKKDYLVREQGIHSSRITIVNGGYRKTREIELWIVPPKDMPRFRRQINSRTDATRDFWLW